jgi:phosphatidylinositol alpha-1,6-mannosyltransferase
MAHHSTLSPRSALDGREGKRILYLLTDAYGGHGGIALYNRDVLEALCADETVSEVVALPRVARLPLTMPLPDTLRFDLQSLGGTAAYLKAFAKLMLSREKFDLVYCAHVNLMPLARLAASRFGAPLLLAIYGIEAWQPSPRAVTRQMCHRADHVMSISSVTLDRFKSWAPYGDAQCSLMPNAIHLDQFEQGPKDPELERRYGLAGRKVILTLGRLADQERYKGFDEVLDVMPDLIQKRPDITYLIAGDGEDAPRLKAKVKSLGLTDHVVFTGMVDESEKARIFRLADVFAMPSRGEGFGFVVLEAMASGIPAIGSIADGTREAMRDGLLGPLVDPLQPDQLKAAILAQIDQPRGIPDGLDYFAFPQFCSRMQALVKSLT